MEIKEKISIIVPCYNERECLEIFLEAVLAETAALPVDLELIFVDDGSTDGSLEIMRKLSQEHSQVGFLALSRNFGKEAALLAGLQAATGDFVVAMDADLQHPPELLPQMYFAIVNEKFDSVAARRIDRKGKAPLRSFFARRFYKLISKATNGEILQGATDFRMMTRQVVDAVLSLTEYNRFTKGIFNWVGFSTKWIEYQNVPRVGGRTKWGFWKLFLYSVDGIVSFSAKPLAISSFFGIIFCFVAFLFAIFIVVRWLMFGDPVQGWASTICIILFVGGVQLFSVGILGQYLAKSYLEAKGRPVYIVKERSE
ncbi:MAG: glycosyltransferase family 2 protein [Clostridiales bacterium]|jgi:glycosyltransferase involved in cell wall biosynthesis|nr:glycosyltransferase family 2 protein [Clostridiales bacterium]